jgi:hypothetical protein
LAWVFSTPNIQSATDIMCPETKPRWFSKAAGVFELLSSNILTRSFNFLDKKQPAQSCARGTDDQGTHKIDQKKV